jgi:hypothetical protein
MKRTLRSLPVFPVLIILMSGCVSATELKGDTAAEADADPSLYRYHFDISANTAGFSLVVNGTEMLSFEGGKSYSQSVNLNDWMVSGNNEFALSLFWPDEAKFTPGKASAAFVLSVERTPPGGKKEESVLYTLQWPGTTAETYPFTVTETFRPGKFPRVLLEKAEPVRGVLNRTDQDEITAVVDQLRAAFSAKDLDAIDGLFAAKYRDIAAARFIKPQELKAEMDDFYTQLFKREAFAVRPLYTRYSFQSTADGRLVKVMQGSISFPEPALVATYRENRRTARYDLDLYFAKVDGKWIIVR